MSEDENIVKRTCKELGVNQKELAEKLEVSPASVSDWAKGEIPKMTKLALELLCKNREYEEKFKILKQAQKILFED